MARRRQGAGRDRDPRSARDQQEAILRKQAERHCTLANQLRRRAENQEAIQLYRRALDLWPDYPEALVNLGNTLKDQGDLTGAIDLLKLALDIRPDFVEALSNLGIAYQQNGDTAAAVAAYRRALALDPDFAPAHSNLGISLTESGALEEAMAAFRRAIELEPDFAEAYSNLGIVLEESGDLEASIAAYRQALALQPDYPEAYCNLGNALQEQGDLEASLSAYRKAIMLRPHYPDARKNLAMAILLSGDYRRGWQAYEWRFQSEPHKTILNAVPRGEPCRGPLPPPGASLLLVSEQGFGDTLQFMRYALPLRQQGLQVRLCAPAKLHALIRASGLDPEPLAPEQVHGRDVGTWLPLLSLPGLLGVSAGDPLVNQPYLRTTDQLHSKWARILADEGGPIVALNWQGNPEHEKSTSKGRSLPLEAFAPLAKIDGVRFLALQKGPGSEQLDACSFRDRFVSCQPLVSDTWDFLETAAMIANCDLVISSDTSAAHLAAGLGKETWLLLKHIAEWRWGLESVRSGWYPAMRLFRQRKRGAWGELMERVAEALERRLAGVTTAQAALQARQEQEGAKSARCDAGQRSSDAPPRLTRQAAPAGDHEGLQELIRRGDLTEAELLCRSLLGRDPQDSEAMAILALLCEAGGRQNERVQWLRRLTELRPEHAADHYNLGVALQQQGQVEACITAYTRALSLQPAFPEALGNLGVAQQACGDLQAAIHSLQRAVALRPQFSDALSNLGNALQQQGDSDGAIDAYERALASRPTFPEAHSNLATSYKEKKRLGDALACCQRALELKPDYPEALSNLGNILQALWQEQQGLPHGSARPEDRQNSDAPGHGRLSVQASTPVILQELATLQAQEGDLAAAMAAYRRALSLRPNYANAHYNLGIAYKDQDRLEEALQCYERAIALKPDYAEAHTNLGNVWQELGEIDKAVKAYQRALSHQPDHPAANKNLSMAWLLQGNYRQGWPHYEWRFRDSPGLDLLFAHPSIPRWDGTPLAAGARLTLVGEQGLGDTLQFMRYVLALHQQGLKVSLCAVKKLHGLIQVSGIDAEPLTPGQANQLQDGTWLPLLSLPGLLGVSPDNPLGSDPYIRSSDERIAAWRRRFAKEQRPIIGINWQGNPAHERTNSRGRSLPLEHFAPLTRMGGFSLLSLQKGQGSEQLDSCSFRDRFVSCQAQVDAAWDFVDTAAIIANCDLVITSDTAVAHLAGGIGQTTWLLLKDVPEWRWGLSGDTTFWYPSMRLFRQRRRGDWPEVLERVAEALKQELRGDRLSRGYQALPETGSPRNIQAERDSLWARAQTCLQQGDLAEAETLHNQGLALQQLGDSKGALKAYEDAIRLQPDFAEAHYNIGCLHFHSGRYKASITAYLNCLRIQPQFPQGLTSLGNAYKRIGNFDAAVDAYESALKTSPHDADTICNLGNTLIEKGNVEAAHAWFQRGLTTNNRHSLLHHNMGLVLQELGDPRGATTAFEQAVAIDPDFAEAHGALAMAYLLAGDYRRGWQEYEWRFRTQHHRHLLCASPRLPRWDGRPLAEGQILTLVSEQGLGDTLQFMRYGLHLKNLGLPVAMCAPKTLHGLIREAGLDDEPLTPEEGNALQSGVWLPLLSLPGLLGVSPERPLISAPYLRSRNDRIEAWRSRLAAEQRPIIAINWQGNPDHEQTTSRGRSLPLEAFAPLASLTGISLLSLQKGPGSEQLDACSFRDRLVSCQSQVDAAWDFVETAAILANCDLVITSDTAVAHLAGGMGRRTWLLLKNVPEWRWGLTGDKTFWYDSMRLFRQTRRGDWTAVIARVVGTLKLAG